MSRGGALVKGLLRRMRDQSPREHGQGSIHFQKFRYRQRKRTENEIGQQVHKRQKTLYARELHTVAPSVSNNPVLAVPGISEPEPELKPRGA